jgi:hypothetical protein
MRVTDVIVKKDVMLHFPYHSFNTIIDLLREAAIDPDVTFDQNNCVPPGIQFKSDQCTDECGGTEKK